MSRARGALMLAAAFAAPACSAEPSAEETPPAANRAGQSRIACALAGAKSFARDCAVERAPDGEALFLVVRHPDGGFRRFEVLKDGRGLAAADGAHPARTAMAGELLEVTVEGDRYRFPVRQASDAAR